MPDLPAPGHQQYLGRFRLSPESAYYLYGAVECLELGPDVAHAAPYMQLDVDALVDANAFRAETITGLYEHWRPTGDPDEVAIIDLMSVLALAEQGTRLVAYAVDVISTEVAGTRALCGRQRDYVDLNDLRGTVQRLLDTEAPGMTERMGLIYERWQDTRRRYTPLEIVQLASRRYDRPADNDRPPTAPVVDERPVFSVEDETIRSVLEHERQQLSRAKRALKRGIRTFQRLFGKDPRLTAFLSGERITVEGQYFDYLITRTTSVLKHTMDADRRYHVPYSLCLYNKQGLYLAEACVYFKHTPVVDQLIGLMTYIKHDCEDEILHKANFFGRALAFYDDPTLRQLGVVRDYRTLPVEDTQDPYVAGRRRRGAIERPRTELMDRLREEGERVQALREQLSDEVQAYVRGHIHVPDRIMDIAREHYLPFDELVDTYRAGVLADDVPLLRRL